MIASGHAVKPSHWSEDKGQVSAKHPAHNKINADLAETIAHVKKSIALSDLQGKMLNSDDVRALFGREEKTKTEVGVLGFMGELIAEMKSMGKYGNANVYAHIKKSVSEFLTTAEGRKFGKGEDLSFDRFNYTFLRKYEVELKGRKLKSTSLSMHFRTLRAVFNEAIHRDFVSREAYPFEKFKVSSFSVETKPRAISKNEIKALESLNISSEKFLFDARNYFLFSYYGCGINFVDLAQLRWQDIEGDVISYTRQKTGRLIEFKVLPNMLNILSYYEAFTGGAPANYVFPILDRGRHVELKQIAYRIDKVDKRVNKALRELSELAGLTRKVTFYVARHTFANELQKSGTPHAVISALMGHQSEKVTRVYLDKLSNEEKFKVLGGLF